MAQPDPGTPLSAFQRIKVLAEMRTAFDFQPLFVGNLLPSTYEFTNHGETNIRIDIRAFKVRDCLQPTFFVPS